ncbi:MAG: acetate--CoA ligase family protein [Burkholderiaceae bacterium]|nr:acetate--CoA ligase family protein [Burkholderiaceae bacterium]
MPVFREQIRGRFAGPCWLVNPAHREIGGEPCYRSLRQTPSVPEHVLVLLPAEHVMGILEEASSAGARSATVYATGWGESGTDGCARQDAIARLAERSGLRICGPNCLGTISVREQLVTYPLRVLEWLQPGGIAAVFQSGALLYPFLRTCGERGGGFSYLVSCGNEADLSVADYVRFLACDGETRAIALLLEGVREPEKFRAVLEMALEAGKHVAVMKVGRSERARESTLTHTGALAGSDRVFDALCRHYGVARCHSLDDLVETTRLFASGLGPRGKRVAVLTFSGALRSEVLDQTDSCGLSVASPSRETQQRLKRVAPTLDCRIANPLDCGYLAGTQSIYAQLGRELAADPEVDVLLVHEHAPDEKRNRRPALLQEIHDASGKPVVVFAETAYSMTPYAREFVSDSGIPFLHGTDRALRAVAALCASAEAQGVRRARTGRTALRAPEAAPGMAPGLYGPGTAGALLARYRIPLAPCRLVSTVDDAVAAADAIGYPVVLKVESPDIAHKTDAGGVRLGLLAAEAVREAWQAIASDLERRRPDARRTGMLVMRMAPPGLEMSLGVHRDPQFGLVMLVGLGGTWVEVLGDVSARLLPVDFPDASAMLAELKAAPLLGAFRGAPARDLPALTRAIVSMGQLAGDLGERLTSMEINPLRVHALGEGVTAVDLRLVLSDPAR